MWRISFPRRSPILFHGGLLGGAPRPFSPLLILVALVLLVPLGLLVLAIGFVVFMLLVTVALVGGILRGTIRGIARLFPGPRRDGRVNVRVIERGEVSP